MEINVINMKNEAVEKLEVPESILASDSKQTVIYEAVRQYQAAGRHGTAATKTRGLVSGSGRKLWKQKGTGRARIGSVRSPLWRHGGTVFGPQPRDYSYRLPKKKRIAALSSAVAQKLKSNSIFVIDEITFENAKTKAVLDLVSSLQLQGKTLFVDSPKNKNLQLSVRNLRGVKFCSIASLNIVDALKYQNLIISKQAYNHLTKILAK